MDKISFQDLCNVIDMSATTMDNYMYVADFINDRYHISAQALERFAVPSVTFSEVAKTHALFVYGPDYPTLKKELEEIADSDRSTHNMQYRWLAKDGVTPIWINCRGNVVRENGKALYMIGCINEIGAKPKADNQTGLLRLGGDATLPVEISHSDFNGFVLRIGIDDLRGINARLGTETGDYVIAQTAEVIISFLDSSQYVYHIVGDEFMILSLSHGTYEDGLALYRNIRNGIVAKIRENGYKVIYTISAGVVSAFDISNYSFESIMKSSEFALSMAKRMGRNTYCRFDAEQYRDHLSKHELEAMLQNSVNQDFAGFSANFQILHSIEKGIIGAETLMRYTDIRGNMVSPIDFIPVMENSGLIIPAGRWILRQAARVCLEVQKYVPDFFVTVNVSYVQVSRTDLDSEVKQILAETGLKPHSLVIELTESGLLESDLHFINTWKKLKEQGVRLALDDFGTGYSNFHYLNELRPDILKIDRSFTVSALSDDYEYALLYNLRTLARNLSLNMCVEGIETKADFDRINEIGPEYVQGFYFGKPTSEDELIKLVEERSR